MSKTWDDTGMFVVEMTVREYYELQRAQRRDGESLEDTLLRLAGLRATPRRQSPPVANDDRAWMSEAAHVRSLADAKNKRENS